MRPVRRHVSLKPVIPAHAGIQTSDFNPVSLDSGFRRNDEKSKRVDGLPLYLTYPAILPIPYNPTNPHNRVKIQFSPLHEPIIARDGSM